MELTIIKTEGTRDSMGSFMVYDENGNEMYDKEGNNAWDRLEEAKKEKG